MNRFSNEEDKVLSSLITRIVADWWTSSSKPIPQRLEFQRFGMQLRDEDFKQDCTPYRGFLIRDRTEARIASSGTSEVKNNDEGFQVTLDVRPFQPGELFVTMLPRLYIMINGEHKERCEDNSVCARKFTRRYMLPKGCGPLVKACAYNKGILTITIEKQEVKSGEEMPKKVPITLEGWNKNKNDPFDLDGTKEVIISGPCPVVINVASKVATVAGDDSKVDPKVVDEPSKATPAPGSDLKVDPEVVDEISKVATTSGDDSEVDPEVTDASKPIIVDEDDSKSHNSEIKNGDEDSSNSVNGK